MNDEQKCNASGASRLSGKLAAALLCPNCQNQGWYAMPNHITEEIEQVQCEFCHSEPNSVFNIAQAANVQIEGQAASGLSRSNVRLGNELETKMDNEILKLAVEHNICNENLSDPYKACILNFAHAIASRTVPQWISVEDRLPEWASRDDTPCVANGEEIGALLTSEKVLVAIAPDNNVRVDNLIAIESDSDEYQYKWFDVYGDRVTHWLPLPQPPENKP